MKHTLSYVFFYLVVFIINPTYSFGEEKKINYSLELLGITKDVTADSTDRAIAEEYAPVMHFSGLGDVNLWTEGLYEYTDYIPINVNDIVSNPERLPNFVLTRETLFGILIPAGAYPLLIGSTDLLKDIIGDPAFNDSTNYLDFSPIWEGVVWTKEDGYRSLSHNPTVYYKVFKDPEQENPIAVQYWFFYFYNDWGVGANHPGDWETITVFLDSDANPKEAIYSTHYEANRHSWDNINTYPTTNHPYVYVANGSHASYHIAGETSYKGTYEYRDMHYGEKEILYPRVSPITNIIVDEEELYSLEDIGDLGSNSWISFEGRWGGKETIDPSDAPPGPRFRTDMPKNLLLKVVSNNPPEDPYDNCKLRYNTNIYRDPWKWASGYGLNDAKCQPKTPDITPDIKANNSDEPITIGASDTLSIKISLSAKDYLGKDCDWWLAVNTPFAPPSDWYYYNLSSGWTPGLSVTYQGGLVNLTTPIEILKMSGMPIGTYTFSFGIDTIMNSSLDFDELYSDSISINVIELSTTTSWPMFGHNPQHTNLSPYIGVQALKSNLKWYSG